MKNIITKVTKNDLYSSLKNSLIRNTHSIQYPNEIKFIKYLNFVGRVLNMKPQIYPANTVHK